MRLTRMPKGNGGFTLVELLITMLIIVILAVGMLPTLKEYIVKAQYAAEAIPVIDTLRVKTALYRVEKDHMPGLVLDEDNKPMNDGKIVGDGTSDSEPASSSSLANAGGGAAGSFNGDYYIQTMAKDPSVGANTTVPWKPCMLINASESDVAAATRYDFAPNGLAYHAFTQIDIKLDNLFGRNLKPHHIQYVVPANKGEGYLYAYGVFGAGDGLAVGTGYAVVEFNYPKKGRRFLMIFERYKAQSSTPLFFASADILGSGSTLTSTTLPSKGTADPSNGAAIYLPAWSTLVGLDGDYTTALTDMRAFGWQ